MLTMINSVAADNAEVSRALALEPHDGWLSGSVCNARLPAGYAVRLDADHAPPGRQLHPRRSPPESGVKQSQHRRANGAGLDQRERGDDHGVRWNRTAGVRRWIASGPMRAHLLKWFMAAVILYAEFDRQVGSGGAGRRIDRRARPTRCGPSRETWNSSCIANATSRAVFVFERYADEEAFQTHIGADYGAVFNAALGDLIEEDGSQLTFLVRRAGRHHEPNRSADRPHHRPVSSSNAARGR